MQIEFNGEKIVNLVIGWGADSRGVFCPLIADSIVDLHFAGGVPSQCFPLFIYEPLNEKEDSPRLDMATKQMAMSI